MGDDFQTGIFSCFSDFKICIITWICPCYTSSRTRARLDDRECVFCDFLAGGHEWSSRTAIRKKFNMEQQYFMDYIMLCLFGQCVTCQNAREVQSRMGWLENH